MPRITRITAVAVRKETLEYATGYASRNREDSEIFRVTGSYTVTDADFDQIADGASHEVFTHWNAEEAANRIPELTCMKLVTPSGRKAYVDTQGYDYPRYFVVPV